MLLITEVKVHKVEGGRPYQVDTRGDYHEPWVLSRYGGCPEEPNNKTEYVTPRIFVRPRTGERYEIGMTKDVQDKIGLPFEAFDNMAQDLAEKRDEINTLKKDKASLVREAKALQKLGFLDRLLLVIFGFRFIWEGKCGI